MEAINSSRQRKAGVVLQYLQMGLSVIIQLLYTPILLRLLGATEYGLYNTTSSIIAYLSLLSLGLGTSYIRFYFILDKNEDKDGIKRMNGLYLSVFLIIGFVALIIGLILSEHIYIFFNNTYSSRDIEIAKLLTVFLTINLAISFPASVFTSYITSQERFIFQKMVNMGKTIFSPAISIIALYLGYGSVGMVITTTCLSIIVDLLNLLYCVIKLKMQISFKNPDFTLLKDIFVFSIFVAINQIVDQINWQTDKIVLGKIVNSSAVAVYAVGSSINSMFTNFSTAISSVFSPKVNMIVSRHEENMDKQLNGLFIKVGRIQWFVLFLIVSGFIFFGKYFVELWAGNMYGNAFWVALLLIAPAIIPLIQNIGLEIQMSKNKHQFRSIVYLFMAIFNVVLSIFFASLWGEIGAAIGTTISIIIANGLIMNIYYHKKIGIDVLEFWKSIISTLPSFIIPILVGSVISYFRLVHSIGLFIIFAVLYIGIYCISVYCIGLNLSEKKMIASLFKRILNR